jgi:hypothetical protein
MKRQSQQGVALIITLILLAVVTVMAVAFLATSRRERGAVTTATDTASARLAADAALAQAEAQIMANVLATTNPYNFSLIVSTNYINSFGFQDGIANPTNVNYDYVAGGGMLNQSEQQQNIANLLYSPRAPVFIVTNQQTGSNDFRFYLDLNRNGVDDASGFIPQTNNLGLPTGATNLEVGDPEWIGVLDHPDQPHGPNNRFIARYAFIAVPIGNALDLNAIYNQAAGKQVNSSTAGTVQDGFMRNQGVGSWEINLAAFLTDLNTNQWDNPLNQPYNYFEPGAYNTGVAFEDALSLISYRYGYSYNLFSIQTLYGLNSAMVFQNDNIDGYSDGSLQTTLDTNESDNPLLSWAGADNTNQFFDMQELFNPNETENGVNPPGFTDRLLAAGNVTPTHQSTYDRYTFYRMMSQLGVDSAPAQNQLNVNYRNVTNGVIVPGMETNFYQWSAAEFFTNAADRMLRAYSQDWLTRDPADYLATYGMTTNIGTVNFPTNIPVSFGITNIPVWIGASNQFVYSSAIQRVLQLAANIYDAAYWTSNSVSGTNFPSVFRPTFSVVLDQNGYTNVYINGYQQVVLTTSPPIDDPQLNTPTNVTSLPLGSSVANYLNGVNVYGVPWIIGAKKGFPNFNQFSMEEVVGIERRLQVTRPAINGANSVNYASFQTNQMYTMAITNSLGVDCWNSYSNNYVPVSGALTIVAQDNLSMALTNDEGMTPVAQSASFANTVNRTVWPGSAPWYGGTPNVNSFDIPLVTNFAMPLNTTYAASSNWWAYSYNYNAFYPFYPSPTTPLNFETNINNNFLFPHFGLLTTNRLQVFMLDGNHVIDYVQFAGPNTSLDLKTNLFVDDISGVWNTNLSTTGVPDGVYNQIQISMGNTSGGVPPSEDGQWNGDAGNAATIPQQQAFFDAFFTPGNVGYAQGVTASNLELSVEAPYSPIRYVILYTTWQANDPVVHYLASDLNYTGESGTPYPGTSVINYGTMVTNLPSLGVLNYHYSPWGGNPLYPPNPNTPDDPNVVDQYNLAVKDPLIYSSDNWDFPTNKLPTVGWLGRVHRGTPWQTVDLKSVLPNNTIWANWSGDFNGSDAYNSSPVQDWQLFDLFTTAPDDNATRGQLSVNLGANDTNNPQAGLAAWSALFSGVVALTNTTPTPGQMIPITYSNWIVSPAGVSGISSLLGLLVTNINATRATFVNDDGLVGSFEHIGDILAAPALTFQSPFLNLNNTAQQQQQQYGINDEMYEWLPQQTLSLLRVGGSPQTPMRYVVYCYGQTLKPALNGIVTSGSDFGLCTNYQIVSEIATRAVVRFNSVLTNVPAMVANSLGQLVWTNAPTPSFVTNNNAVIESFNVLPPE